MVVDKQTEIATQIIFYQLAQTRLPMDVAFGCTHNVVTVWEKASIVCGRVRDDIEDVPYILGDRQRGPLKCDTKSW